MHVEKNIYFRDVNDFIDRVKNMTNVKNAKLIRQNFYICFCEMLCKDMHSIEKLNSILLLITRKFQNEKQLYTKNRK